MLAKKPQDRYARAGDIAAALRPHARVSQLLRALSGEGESTVTELPASSRKTAMRSQRRAMSRKWLLLPLLAVGLFGFMGFLLVMAYLFWAVSDKEKPAIAVRAPTTAAPSKLPGPASTARTIAPPVTGDNNTGKATADSGLLAHWLLDEKSGTAAADASRKGAHATLHGATWAPGKIGGAVYLNGQDAYVDYGAAPRFQFADQAGFTFAGWVKTTANYGPIVSQRAGSNENPVIDIMVGYDGGSDEPGRLMALVRDDNHKEGYARVTGGAVNDGQWHHFALVRIGTTITLYLDGAVQGSSTSAAAGGPITTDLHTFGSERFWIKADSPKAGLRYLQGWIDDMRIYGRSLSAAEITALAKAHSN
jgi:hypothetical protein